MLPKRFDLLDKDTPLVFADGTEVFNRLKEKYITHKKGFFILAPSGAGKTYFIKQQKELHWIDGDELWMSAKAHPEGEWWLEDLQTIFEVDQRSDIITVQAKKLGFWVVGASNYWLTPDAIVLPHWSTHKRYIRSREKGNYDGGATSKIFDQVLNHRKVIAQYIKKGVPKFNSVAEAARYLESTV